MQVEITGRFDTVRIAGRWERRRKLLTTQLVPVFDFRNDAADPLTIALGDLRLRPNRTFAKFDFMSVPLLLQGAVSPLMSPEAGALHDSGYEFHGLWMVGPDGTEIFREMERAEVDGVLLEAVRVSHGDYAARKVWLGVRAGGGGPWARAPVVENRRRFMSIPVAGQVYWDVTAADEA